VHFSAVNRPTSASQKTTVLKKVPFLKGLSDTDLKQVAQKFSETRFKRGEYLYLEGDPSDRLYVVKSGKVKITKGSSSGKEIVLDIISSGEICGGSAVYSQVNPASALAAEDVIAYGLSKKDFLRLLSTYRTLAVQFIMYLGEKLMRAHEMMMSLVASNVEKRIAALLLGLCEKHGSQTAQGIRINLRLTRQDIADIVGTTVETTIRVMSKLGKQGILITESKHIVVTSKEKLSRLLLN
jgi:CRP/FNR family cyclic AMP-dependent transcriptional regulator